MFQDIIVENTDIGRAICCNLLVSSIHPILLVSLVTHDHILAALATKNPTSGSKGIFDVARAEYDEESGYQGGG